jgi:predicted peptidase
MSGKQTMQRMPSGLSYHLYVPPSHASSTALWPLLLCLHGAGEMGTDLRQLFDEGATGLPAHRLQQPPPQPGALPAPEALAQRFIVVSPQTNRGWRARELAAFTEALTQDPRLRIDPHRRYVTGVSMGGAGAVAAAGTGLFAAVVPICAAGGDVGAIDELTAVWLFHGANDVIVGVEYSDESHLLLQRQRASRPGAAELKYTRYEKAPAPVGWPRYDGHASWIPTYSMPELYDWLLRQSRETFGSGSG